jgi:hypothetical protein
MAKDDDEVPLQSSAIYLGRATLAALDKAFEPGVARGDRYPAPMMARLGL